MRRKDHPSFPSAITCCFLSSLKTLLMPREPIRALFGVNVPGFALAGFQLTLHGRFWGTPEVIHFCLRCRFLGEAPSSSMSAVSTDSMRIKRKSKFTITRMCWCQCWLGCTRRGWQAMPRWATPSPRPQMFELAMESALAPIAPNEWFGEFGRMAPYSTETGKDPLALPSGLEQIPFGLQPNANWPKFAV